MAVYHAIFVLYALLAQCAADVPALASDLDLSGFDGRVNACAVPLVTHNDTCTCDAGWTWENNACVRCTAGTFKPEPGVHACSNCPLLTTSFEGASEIEDCLCNAGFQNLQDSCQACASGKYKSFVGNNSCVACPIHSDTAGMAADSLDACKCVEGYIIDADGNEACKPCAQNQFSSGSGASTCFNCPLYSGTVSVASKSSDCQCNAGYTAGTDDDFLCIACAEAKYKDVQNMRNCTSCPQHMFSRAAATSLQHCRCKAGYEKITENYCDICAENSYCPGEDQKVACPANSTSTSGTTSIHGCVCVPGFFWYNALCEPCSKDFFCTNNTRVACPNNSSSPVLSVSIENCTCLPGFH